MSKLLISGVTVSFSYSDKEYGKGSEYFQNISAKHDGIALEELSEVVDQSLDLYFACWKSVLTNRLITGQMKSEDYKITLAAALARIEKVKTFLRKHEPNQ